MRAYLYRYKKIVTFLICIIAIFVFSFLKIFSQEIIVNENSLYVTGVNSNESFVVPYIGGGASGDFMFCGLVSFYSTQQSSIVPRYRALPSGDWVFSQSNPASLSQTWTNLNIIFANALMSDTLYEVEFLEYSTQTNEFYTIGSNARFEVCSPSSSGSVSSACSSSSPDVVLSANSGGCSVNAFNQALQQSNINSDIFATISEVETTQESISFVVTSNGVDVGDTIGVLYTQDLSGFLADDYTNITNQTWTVTPENNGVIPITIQGLSPETQYYVSVQSGSGSGFIILNTSNNLSYIPITTSSVSGASDNQSGGSVGNTAGNITINVDSGFNTGPGGEVANEVSQGGLVQCGFGQFYDCDFNALLSTINRILRFLTFVIALPLAALLFAFAGIRLIVAKASAKQAELTKAKEMLVQVVKGVVIMLSAWIIVQLILVTLGFSDSIVVQILNINLN